MSDRLSVFPSVQDANADQATTVSGNGGLQRGKLRISRGPLRWWLMIIGLLATEIDSTRLLVGYAIILAGAVLHVCSKAILTQNQELTKGGPYRFTRNPFYLATLIAEVGLLLVIGQWSVAIPYLILWGVIYDRTIRFEESHLSRTFGAAHADYVRRVPRLFPIPGLYLPAAEVSGPKFSWTNPNIVAELAFVRASRLLIYPLMFYVAECVRQSALFGLSVDGTRLASAVAGMVAIHAVAHGLTKFFQQRAHRQSVLTRPSAETGGNDSASREAA